MAQRSQTTGFLLLSDLLQMITHACCVHLPLERQDLGE
jgi:hypothetical protein